MTGISRPLGERAVSRQLPADRRRPRCCTTTGAGTGARSCTPTAIGTGRGGLSSPTPPALASRTCGEWSGLRCGLRLRSRVSGEVTCSQLSPSPYRSAHERLAASANLRHRRRRPLQQGFAGRCASRRLARAGGFPVPVVCWPLPLGGRCFPRLDRLGLSWRQSAGYFPSRAHVPLCLWMTGGWGGRRREDPCAARTTPAVRRVARTSARTRRRGIGALVGAAAEVKTGPMVASSVGGDAPRGNVLGRPGRRTNGSPSGAVASGSEDMPMACGAARWCQRCSTTSPWRR